MTRAAEDYLDFMEARGYSPATVSGASRYLAYLVSWLAERGVTRPDQVTLPVLDRYQRHVYLHRKANGQPLTLHTQNQRIIPVKGLFRFLARQRRISSNPAADLLLTRQGHRLPANTFTIDQVEAVMAVPDIATAAGLRDRTILEVLYSCGLRRGELVRLRLCDVDHARGVIFVSQGKGKRDRFVPIGERATAWTQKYLADSRPTLAAGGDEGWLFVTAGGEQLSAAGLTTTTKGYIRGAGMVIVGSCHLFRHAAATHMLEGGADVRYVQEFLGHVSLDATQVYTHVSIAKLSAVHQATHPGARNVPRGTRDDGEAS